MTKHEILEKFNDIDFVYNDSSKHDTLSKMLDDLLKEQPQIVRCKDCKYRGNANKCVIASMANEKDYLISIFDNRGEWYCADGERKEGR